MIFLIFLLSLFLIGVGFSQLLGSGDSAWSRHEWQMRARGIVVSMERTPEWDTNRKIGGAITISAGVLILVFGVMAASKSQSRDPDMTPNFWLNGTPISPEEAGRLGIPDMLDQNKTLCPLICTRTRAPPMARSSRAN